MRYTLLPSSTTSSAHRASTFRKPLIESTGYELVPTSVLLEVGYRSTRVASDGRTPEWLRARCAMDVRIIRSFDDFSLSRWSCRIPVRVPLLPPRMLGSLYLAYSSDLGVLSPCQS